MQVRKAKTFAKSNWEQVVFSQAPTLFELIRSVDESGLRAALIVNSKMKILDLFTDGDLRRLILSGKSLNDKIFPRRRKCISIQENASIEQAKHVIFSQDLSCLPLVNEDGSLTAVLFPVDFIERPQPKVCAVIMAGGLGTRLAPLTNHTPKPMLEVNDKPILEYSIELLMRSGVTEIFISVNYLREQIIEHFSNGAKHGVNIRYLHEEYPLGTAGSLGKIDEEDVPEKLIVLNGDILTNINLNKMLEFHHNQENMITIAGKKHFINNPYGTLTCVENQLVGFVEKPVYESIINTGIYCINKDVLSFVNGKKNYDMPSLIEKTQQTKNIVGVYTDDFSWLDIGTEDSFREAPDFAKKILFNISNDL